MFWNNLTEIEGDEYISLGRIINPWVAWRSIKPKLRVFQPEPTRPTDAQLHRVEMIAMKGWGMQHGPVASVAS